MSRYLMIVEVSQKQAYIFESNRLRDNVYNSSVIAYVTGKEFFELLANDKNDIYREDLNLVYSGGGHTILEFETEEKAKEFSFILTRKVIRIYPGLELFVKIMAYDDELTYSQNLKKLIGQLEKKKSIRRASFKQGTYGVEAVNAGTKKPVLRMVETNNAAGVDTYDLDRSMVPEGFIPAKAFTDLGGTRGDSNYIAVVHIDGNGMGDRVNRKYEELDEICENWESFKREVRVFSEDLDRKYKSAYRDMNLTVADQIKKGRLEELDLRRDGVSGDLFFPIRRIITSGDDICFVTEGRIGVESAVAFIKALKKQDKGLAACAGVAIVHQKYPFFKAYDLAESLCSNAKKFNANCAGSKQKGNEISSIDWHIDQGEIKDSIDDIREDYISEDNEYHLEMRPYAVDGPIDITNNKKIPTYDQFRQLMVKLIDDTKGDVDGGMSRGKLKNMREPLRRGKVEIEHYINYYKLGEQGIDADIMLKRTADNELRAVYFDAIELVDTYIPFALMDGGESIED